MDRILIAGEVDRVHSVIWEVTAQPFNALQVRGKAVLDDQILTKTQDVGGIEQSLFLGRRKEFLSRLLQALFNTDFV